MSKIYRSIDSGPAVHALDFSQTPMGPQRADRPAGGFAGWSAGAVPAEATLSRIERREREAQRLLEEARSQAEAIQRDAWHAGFAEGEKAGLKLAQQKIDPTLQALTTLMQSIENGRAELVRQYEHDLIKVAFAIATQVLHRELEMAPGQAGELITAALAKLSRSQAITLRLSPIDAQLLEQQMQQGEGIDWPPDHLKIESDEAIGRGGCLIETDTGDIDATIDMQLRVLRDTLWTE